MDQSKFRQRVEDKKEDLISLTQDLIKIPTVNPPGEFYSDCVEYLNKRFKSKGFNTQIIRATGTPGDTDRYPRENIVAICGMAGGHGCHFTGPMAV